jgi:hypothetical protein
MEIYANCGVVILKKRLGFTYDPLKNDLERELHKTWIMEGKKCAFQHQRAPKGKCNREINITLKITLINKTWRAARSIFGEVKIAKSKIFGLSKKFRLNRS